MKALKVTSIFLILLSVYACSHPIEIEGQGDVYSSNGRLCTYENSIAIPLPDNCAKNIVIGNLDYNDIYTAAPRDGWQFDHWDNCFDGVAVEFEDTCSFDVPANVVQKFAGEAAPPLIAVFTELDTDGDGIPDATDPCPANPTNPCQLITGADMVTVDGEDWVQPDLFTDLSWEDISDVCPGGNCGNTGTLNGYDVNGRTWASVDEVNALFNIYLSAAGVTGDDLLGPGPGPDAYSGTVSDQFAQDFWNGLWRPMSTPPSLELAGWTSTSWTDPDFAQVGFVYDSSIVGNPIDIGTTPSPPKIETQSFRGAWLYGNPQAVFTGAGIFLDSAVGGISYACSSGNPRTTKTSPKGEYYCDPNPGEEVTFSIGNIVFPPVIAQSIVTPLDIAESFDLTNDKVINISRLLQTLDEDGDLSNGIDIIPLVLALGGTVSPLNFDQSPANFEADAAPFVTAAGLTFDPLVTDLTLVTPLEAVEHVVGELIADPDVVTFAAYSESSNFLGDFVGEGIAALDLRTGESTSSAQVSLVGGGASWSVVGSMMGAFWDATDPNAPTLIGPSGEVRVVTGSWAVGETFESIFDEEQIVFDLTPGGTTTFTGSTESAVGTTTLTTLPLPPPTLTAAFTYIFSLPETTLDASGSTAPPTRTIVAYDWDIDNDGDFDDYSGPVVVHIFAPGTYPVALMVTDSEGDTDTTSQDVCILC